MNDQELDARYARWALSPSTLYLEASRKILEDRTRTPFQRKGFFIIEMMSQLYPYPGAYSDEETRALSWIEKSIKTGVLIEIQLGGTTFIGLSDHVSSHGTMRTPQIKAMSCGGCGQLGQTGGPHCTCDCDIGDCRVDSRFDDLHNTAIKRKLMAKSNGMTCSGPCGEFNEYAEANRPNGTFVCYSCRSK